MDEQEPNGPNWWGRLLVWIVAVTQVADVVTRVVEIVRGY